MAEVDPNVMKQLLSQMGENKLTKLAPAFVAAWGEIGSGVEKNANNPHFGNDYADLSAVIEKCKPILSKHKLALLQAPGELDGDKLTVMSVLIHESGESITIKTQMPLGGKSTSQAAGSASTYGKRYAFKSIFGLADVDDDGEASSAPPQKKKGKEPNYADGVASLMAAIETWEGSVDELEKTLRPQVEDLADEKVNSAYVAKRRALKTAAKGK